MHSTEAMARTAASRSLLPVRTPTADDDAQFDEQRLAVLVDYSAVLRRQMVLIALVMAALAALSGSSWLHIGLWLAATLAMREWRAAALLGMVKRPEQPIAHRLQRCTWLTLGLALAYGLSAALMLGRDTSDLAIMTMILLSLSAGAVSTTYTVFPAFVAFACGISFPVILLWVWQEQTVGLGVAVMLLLFVGVQIRFARQNMRLFTESFRMRQENADLLAQLSAERELLVQARDEAVAAGLSKSRFLASASHDLRQPLQGLSLNGSALMRQPLSQDAREIAQEIAEGIEVLRHMLDGLLDASQLDSGAVTPQMRSLPLQRFLDSVCARFRSNAQAKGLVLSHSCPADVWVTSDAQLLQRVVSNLLDNALKFTGAGCIRVDVSVQGQQAIVRVNDTGIGIAPADQAQVFEEFVQLGNAHRDRQRGHGLGLGIVRRLCNLLGVEITLQSQLGAGSTFTLKLPLASGEGATDGDQPPELPLLAGRRVLVLDDDDAVRLACQTVLKGMGCDVCLAETIEEALSLVSVRAPEVALIDHRLAGEINGLAAVPLLRALRPNLPAIILSADASAELAQEAGRLHVPVLRKPVTESMLVSTLHRALTEAAIR